MNTCKQKITLLHDSLKKATSALAEVLQVPLVITDEAGDQITDWEFPSRFKDKVDLVSPLLVQVPSMQFELSGCPVFEEVNGSGRRLVVNVSSDTPWGVLIVHSAVLSPSCQWLGRSAGQQVLPGCPFSMKVTSEELMKAYVSEVYRSVLEKCSGPDGVELNDVDIENIRRVGVSLLWRIVPTIDPLNCINRFSLEVIPDLKEFFLYGGVESQHSKELREIFRLATIGIRASFNLMGLTGDFAIESVPFSSPVCSLLVRQYGGDICFLSDISYLIRAALLGRKESGQARALWGRSHLAQTEVFAPILSQGLIVGIVVGGEMFANQEDLKTFRSFSGVGNHEEMNQLRLTPQTHINRAQKVVEGLAGLMGLLIDNYSLLRSKTGLLEVLVELGTEDDRREIFAQACAAVKKFVTVSHCSIFSFDGRQLVLEATTVERLIIRDDTKSEPRTVPVEEAIGQPFYKPGQGLTGSVCFSNKPRFEVNATEAEDWSGFCCEEGMPSQCFIAPITQVGDVLLGVVRAVKPVTLGLFSPEQRNLLADFARELGIVLHNHELVSSDTRVLQKRLAALQYGLAEGIHEFRSPLHNILSLSTEIRHIHPSDSTGIKEIHERLKDEVYKLGRRINNYLVVSLEGRDDMKYNFQKIELSDIIIRCVERFRHFASRRNIQITYDKSVKALPTIDGDGGKLEQVFENLTENAVKYSFDNQTVGISAKTKERTVTVSISDFGLGIPLNVQGKIFEGYTRSVEDKCRFKPGTGLGLRISLQIVKKHYGEIYVHSEPLFVDPRRVGLNEGFHTMFTVMLPRRLDETMKGFYHEDASD